MTYRFNPIARISAIGALAAILAGTAPPPALSETPANMLVVADRIDDIKTLDPAESFEFSGSDISRNVYEKLVNFNPFDLDAGFGPQLAESWTLSEDGKAC